MQIRLASNGKVSCIELCGKSIGKSVDHILFEHDTNTNTKRLELGIDLNSFEFLEDGYFDKFEKMLDEEESPENFRNSDRQKIADLEKQIQSQQEEIDLLIKFCNTGKVPDGLRTEFFQ